MIQSVAWNTRTFTFNLPLDAFPAVVERLRGTAAGAAELVSGVSEELLSRRWKGQWSARSVGSVFYFSSAEFLRNVLFRNWLFKDLPSSAAYRPEINVICPPTAYELETVQLTVMVRRNDGVAKPWRFSIESPAGVEEQGTKERQVQNSESWFLLPKEQGEYVIVVRGLGDVRPFTFEQHLSVRKFDGFTRRQFVFWTCWAVSPVSLAPS
jgi:hypothetical protein